MKKIILWGVGLGVVAPSIVFAASAFSILAVLANILQFIIPILITLAVVYFIWGVVQYILGGDGEKKKEARAKIIGGLVGLFIIVAFWGIIRLVTNTFDVGPEQLNPDAIPCIPNFQAGIVC